jgi:hypothetical protein
MPLPGVVAESEKIMGGGNYYTKIIFDDTLTLTLSSADAAWCLPRHAMFRAGYTAEVQLGLFDKRPQKIEGPYYAIVTHGPSRRESSSNLPFDFCQIGFPDNEYKTFVHRVNLLKAYETLVCAPARA